MTDTLLPSDQTRRGVIRWIIRETFGVIFVGVTLFWPAGTLNWIWGWVLVALYALWTLANGLIIGSRSPELLAERANRRPGTKRWDMLIMSVVGIITIIKHITAGLDFRLGWSPSLPLWLHLLGTALAAAGYALTTWGMAENAFFSLVVRIQADRGHQVISSGPYRYVRHPGYAGTILFELTTPLLLGSWWAFIPSGIAALLMVVRTTLEDRTLYQELAGYQEYTRRVHYRLFPGIW